MHRIIRLVPIALAVLALGACGSPKPIKLYTIQVPAAPTPTTHTYALDMLVARVTGPSVLEGEPIVYKTSSNQIGTYSFHRWTDPPVDMVQDKLMRLLRKSGDYQSVGPAEKSLAGELIVRGRLDEFSEVDGAAISGLVTMEFELYSRKTGKILWSHFYSQSEPVEGKLVPAVVQALDRNLDRGLNEVVAGLKQYFAANPPGRS